MNQIKLQGSLLIININFNVYITANQNTDPDLWFWWNWFFGPIYKVFFLMDNLNFVLLYKHFIKEKLSENLELQPGIEPGTLE